MAGVDDIDITVDLNGQAPDSQPYNAGDVQNGTPIAPSPDTAQRIDDSAKESDPKSPNLRDLLTNAFKGETTPAEPAPVSPPVSPEGQAPSLVKVGERYHNPDGTFASQESIDAFLGKQVPQGEAPALPAWATQLTPLEQQQFTALPAETRQFVERTMEAVNQRGAALQEYETLESVIGPRRQAWAEGGMSPLVAINNLFSLSDFAGRDPAQFVLWFADQHRLDLDAILDERDAQQNTQQDPRLNGLQNEIASLKNTIDGFSQQTVQQEQANNLRIVQQFMDERDTDGNLIYPHFGVLSQDIAQHVGMIRQQQPYLSQVDVLKAAYDFATYNNPAIRAEVQKEALEKARKAAAAEAAKARQAGGSINGGPAGDTSQPQNANRTLREELEYQYNQSTLN